MANRSCKFSDLPDGPLNYILRYYALSNPTATRIRLVSTQIGALSLPHIMHTISLCCAKALARLLSAAYSPLYFPPFLKHVRCLEMRFNPLDYGLRGGDVWFLLGKSLPESIETVRFRFKAGVCLNADSDLSSNEMEIGKALAQDTLAMPTAMWLNTSCLAFLSKFNPLRFEWIASNSGSGSSSPDEFSLLGANPLLRHLFAHWKRVSYIYLDGICLVDQPNLTTWNYLLLAKVVHIRGPIPHLEAVILRKKTKGCRFLRLEALRPSEGEAIHQHISRPGKGEPELNEREVIAFACGITMVGLNGWSDLDIEDLNARVRGKKVPYAPSTDSDPLSACKQMMSAMFPQSSGLTSGSFLALWLVYLLFLGILATYLFDSNKLQINLNLNLRHWSFQVEPLFAPTHRSAGGAARFNF